VTYSETLLTEDGIFVVTVGVMVGTVLGVMDGNPINGLLLDGSAEGLLLDGSAERTTDDFIVGADVMTGSFEGAIEG
jgi:hypothetical protein